MRVWLMSPTAVAVHFRPDCRRRMFANPIEIELRAEHVHWEWDSHEHAWWPQSLVIEVNGKQRRYGPCVLCCPSEGPKDALRYGDCMRWLSRQLGSKPPDMPPREL